MSHFTSPEAAKWARNKICHSFVLERGLTILPQDGEQIFPVLEQIEHFGWTKFAQNPGPAVSTLVREFYANMDLKTLTSTVREDVIYFAPKIINRIYDTLDVDDIQVQVLLSEGTFEMFVTPLCPNGINWHVDIQGNRDWFASINLSLPAKVWMLFLNSRLVPNRHTSEVRASRAAWLCTIEHRYHINVGRIICKRPPLDMGYRHTSDIAIGTVRSLGPCLGPANEQEQVQVQVKAQKRRYPTTTHLQRIEDKIDNLFIIQQQIREDIAFIRTTLLSSIVNLMWNIKNTQNVPNVFSPYVYQNICFPLGNTNLQEKQSMDAYQTLDFAMEQ
ncbi:hypothetical protein T459_02818 [Capsicum annuum]|uniref:Putative plant transposon protein domain-containing protein n=1 Tax=Capsicum annuum TaxID=4072 RepID=A0A2G3AL14_CAPAN|nr:hypothetical protein T459_02818 [Capsicum annuum]